MDEGSIARRYAKALLKYALERGCADRIYAQAKCFEANAAGESDLRKIVLIPVLSAAEKEAILSTAAGAETDSDFLQFIRLVLKNRREAYFRAICLMYQKLYRELNRMVQVKIVTAVALSDEVLDKIKQLVSSNNSDQPIEFVHETDPTILGGFILKYDSLQLDASVNNKLKQLRLKLLK